MKIAVKPPPMATIDAANGTLAATVLSGLAKSSFFHAEDAATAARAMAVEEFETVF